MTLKLPDMLYIQIEDDYGDLLDSVDDIETYSWERVHRTDAVYIRAGKRVPRRAELENLQSALARAISIIHQLEAATETASVTWVGGQPMGVMAREREDRTMNDDSREIDRELFRSALNWINGLEKVASDAITRAENAEAEVTALKAWIAECHENYYELEARIAEMEAGAQWRPASEPPAEHVPVYVAFVEVPDQPQEAPAP